MANKPPTNKPDSFLGWLGRQIGHVKKAVKTDVTKSPAAEKPKPTSTDAPAASPTVIYRDDKVEEAEHPTEPGLRLRRTVIDEVIVDPEKTK